MVTAAITTRRSKTYHAKLKCAAPSGVYDRVIVIDADTDYERASCPRCWDRLGYQWAVTE